MTLRSRALTVSLVTLLAGAGVYAQQEHQVPPPEAQNSNDNDYGARFFDQLRRIFGRFRDTDLRRAFDSARSPQCSELSTDKGEWREVAFFNDDRRLGDWYRTSLDEVKSDLAVYIFKGACGGSHAGLQLTTKFPVEESISRYADGRIRLDQIDVNVNAPVSAVYDPGSRAYAFDLPYLFRTTKNGEPIYTLYPRSLSDRYATDVANHWDCKTVTAEDVTYQFLICRNSLVPRVASRVTNGSRGGFEPSTGSAAYSILSDGKEASSSVKLSFGNEDVPDATRTDRRPGEPSVAAPAPAAPHAATRAWRPAGAQSRLTDVGLSEFRLRFKPEIWKGRIDRPQFIADGMVATLTVAPRNKDYCEWKPRAASLATQLLEPSTAESTIHSLEFRKDAQGVVATFNMESDSGSAVGSLQCSFPQTGTPADIMVGRWSAISGSVITLETPGQ